MFINQINIYLENKPGALRELTALLGTGGINLLAISIADTTDFGVVRTVVKSEQIEPTIALLRENGYIAKVNEVLCVKMPHVPNSFTFVLETLDQAGQPVEYCYSFCRSTLDDAVVIIRPKDNAVALDALHKAGISLLTQNEVDQL